MSTSEAHSAPAQLDWSLAYRTVATGFCFAVFGAAGLLLWCLTPLLWLVPRRYRQRVARVAVRGFFRFFVWLMASVGVLTYEIVGREHLDGARLVVANHPTLIDVVLLLSLMPQAGCVVRKGLAKNLFTRGPVGVAGYVTNDEGQGMLDGCGKALEQGTPLVIFPEGTRTPRQGPMVLKRGAANVAVRFGIPVTPAVITCTPLTLGKGEPWYRVPPRRPHFRVKIFPALDVGAFASAQLPHPLAVRRLNGHLERLFLEETRGGVGN